MLTLLLYLALLDRDARLFNAAMIKESAIRQDGKVYTGRRHHNIIALMIEQGLPRPIRGEQGFVTDDGHFVTRTEAARIALICGQIEKLKYSDTELFSEDLY